MYARKSDGALDTTREWKEVPLSIAEHAMIEVGYILYCHSDFSIVAREVYKNGEVIKQYAVLNAGRYVLKNVNLKEAAEYIEEEAHRILGEEAIKAEAWAEQCDRLQREKERL